MSGTVQARRTAPVARVSAGAVGISAVPDYNDTERREVTAAAYDRMQRHPGDVDIRRRVLEEVVLANQGVARSLASSYLGRGVPGEDLEQVAYTGLVLAANRFRPEEGSDFLSFAVPTIRGHVKRHFRDHGWAVRPPRRVQEIQVRVLASRERLAGSMDRVPTTADIAADLGESEHHVRQALSLDGCFTPSSLDVPVASGTATLGDLVPDEGPDDRKAAEARVMLGAAVRELGERDRYVLGLRYFDGLTQKEIGDELGMTQAQVSRILTRITRELRQCLVSPHGSYASMGGRLAG